jgi:hypothetical protein
MIAIRTAPEHPPSESHPPSPDRQTNSFIEKLNRGRYPAWWIWTLHSHPYLLALLSLEVIQVFKEFGLRRFIQFEKRY